MHVKQFPSGGRKVSRAFPGDFLGMHKQTFISSILKHKIAYSKNNLR